ncbi:hypothetical protein KIN20_027425 [Parelaphostrongylus tenuis]|uniref:Uncharacterized protein n=1 Tax=Parelaphostrongylus tenuis TaxID=148309 RepID=A0AAD5WE35_PARTN|nr:hypothetical protein KIN20_027424 [Parelaphostrongylus tenuis]KAJ1366684.1 hypothetical protein KIN20_027425 [Parelaphostrongylus tenuis]
MVSYEETEGSGKEDKCLPCPASEASLTTTDPETLCQKPCISENATTAAMATTTASEHCICEDTTTAAIATARPPKCNKQ